MDGWSSWSDHGVHVSISLRKVPSLPNLIYIRLHLNSTRLPSPSIHPPLLIQPPLSISIPSFKSSFHHPDYRHFSHRPPSPPLPRAASSRGWVPGPRCRLSWAGRGTSRRSLQWSWVSWVLGRGCCCCCCCWFWSCWMGGLLCGGAWRLFFQLSFLLLVLRVKVMRLDNWRRGDRRRRKDSIIAREKARLLFILVSKALKRVLVEANSVKRGKRNDVRSRQGCLSKARVISCPGGHTKW